MTQEDLKLKVINAEAKVAKRTAVLKKHREQLAKLIQKGADKFDISIKQSDIESAVDKLEEAKQILTNWQAKLDERIAADDYLEANAPEILKDFLENWKQHAITYYREKRIRFIEYCHFIFLGLRIRFIQRIILLGMTFAAQALQHTEKPCSLFRALIQYPAISQHIQWIFKLQQI